jgi:hypothetical protein
MRNSHLLRELLGTFLTLLSCGFCSASWTLTACAEEPSYTPAPSACEVRYHFREHFRNAKPGEKTVSAPSFEREGLPKLHVADLNGVPERIVEGRVAHLPYRFLVKISRADNGSEAETLEVNVLDSSGRPLAGFPQVMPNPLTKGGDISRKAFEIPIDQALKEKIEKALLAKEQFITHVDLIVGMDDDFLSQDFPK